MEKAFFFALACAAAVLAESPAPTPEQEAELLKEVRVPEQFEARIFAVPPAVNYPVFVAAAPDGTLFVSSDRNGSLDRKEHRGRVLRVRDTNDDGHADEVKEFVPDVDSPRGLVWDRDRLYLLHPPHLSAFIDRDGDGVAEEEKVLVKNIAFTFKDRPADHSSNGIELGVDGWIYCAIGDFGFMEAEGTDGRKLQLRGGGVVRVRPDGSGLELYSRGTRNILEACVSPLLDVFARDNTNDGDGWDIRLHHLTGLSEHGYPSLFKNFPDEHVAPLADYGGGSGCGGMYLSEPGFPEGYGEALYTADWGREWIYRHRLTPKGATFAADQTEFVRAPRVTDLDADASGRIYVSSWKGASFTYVGENVGFLVRVTPKEDRPEPLPNFAKASDRELIALLLSPSHIRRLAAQRELLARPFAAKEVESLARDKTAPLASRVAALFALKQKFAEKSHAFLAELLADPAIQAFAVKALADVPAKREGVPLGELAATLRSSDARARREAAFALSRVGAANEAKAVATLLGDEDAVTRHTAIQALKSMKASEPCFAVLDSPGSSDRERNGALQVLQALHSSEVVGGLAERLKRSAPAQRRGLIVALARLHFTAGEWKGDSWGTRPDTSGPYYQPDTWAESERIAALLKAELKASAGEEAAFMARELTRHKISDPEIASTLLHLASRDNSLAPAVAAQLARSESIPAEALPVLAEAALSSNGSGAVRAQAVVALAKSKRPEAVAPMLKAMPLLQRDRDAGREGQQARQAFLRGASSPAMLAAYRAAAEKIDGDESVWADAALIASSEGRGAPAETREAARELVDAAWNSGSTARRAQMLRAIAAAEHRGSRERVLEAMEDPNAEVAEAAKQAARALRVDRQPKKQPEPMIASLSPEDVLAQAAAIKGDRKLGEELFVRQTCNACHTVSAEEPLRGPFLGNIAAIYKRNELAAAVLFPNRTIAQGFSAHRIETRDGTEHEGFVVQESASAVTLRNVAAQEVTVPVDQIAKRTRLEKSIMPEGLAANLTLREFASLLDYLENLAAASK